MMDPMLTRPKNHKARNPWPLIILLGIALTCFVVAARGLQDVAAILEEPV